MPDMIAEQEHEYGGRTVSKGERFHVDDHHVGLLLAHRWARLALLPLSEEAAEERKPPPPETLVDARQDRVETPPAATRPATAKRKQQPRGA